MTDNRYHTSDHDYVPPSFHDDDDAPDILKTVKDRSSGEYLGLGAELTGAKPAPNPNHAPVVPIVEAVMAYKTAQQQFEQAEIGTLTETHCWLDFHIAAHTLSELVVDAYERGAKLE